jgi:hypothetical protein
LEWRIIGDEIRWRKQGTRLKEEGGDNEEDGERQSVEEGSNSHYSGRTSLPKWFPPFSGRREYGGSSLVEGQTLQGMSWDVRLRESLGREGPVVVKGGWS